MECEGTWQERPNLEAPEIPLLVCDGCGEMAVIHKGQMITIKPGAAT